MDAILPQAAAAVTAVVATGAAISTATRAYIIVEHGTRVAVLRSGTYHRLLGPGLHLLFPFFDVPVRFKWTYDRISENGETSSAITVSGCAVPMRTFFANSKGISGVFTRDGFYVQVYLTLGIRVIDPALALFGMDNPIGCIVQMASGALEEETRAAPFKDVVLGAKSYSDKVCASITAFAPQFGKFGFTVESISLSVKGGGKEQDELYKDLVRISAEARASMLKEIEARHKRKIAFKEKKFELKLKEAEEKSDATRLLCKRRAEADAEIYWLEQDAAFTKKRRRFMEDDEAEIGDC